MDVFSCEGAVLQPGARACVRTGLQMQLPDGYEAQVRPRSGLALKRGVTVLNAPGTVDAGYRGEVGVILVNHGEEPFVVEPGMKIAQMVVAPVERAEIAESDVLSSTERGTGGFGSTGGIGASGEYELAGIETIARGVCVADGRILLCRARGGKTTYLPGGHIEFGETGREALVREVREELGLDAETGAFLGVVENAFQQHGKPHAEINLVYELRLPAGAGIAAREDWISFEWRALDDLSDLLPEAFRRLSGDGRAHFAP